MWIKAVIACCGVFLCRNSLKNRLFGRGTGGEDSISDSGNTADLTERDRSPVGRDGGHPTPPSQNSESTGLGTEFLDFTNEIVGALPSRVKNIGAIMKMDTEGFGESPNEDVQKLIMAYNENKMKLAQATFSGQRSWNPGQSRPFYMDFTRDGFQVKCSCGQCNACISQGKASYGDDWDKDCLDTYYLYAFTVFDPKRFETVKSASLEVTDPNTGQTQTIEVNEVHSRETTLYFGKSDGKLYRMGLRHGGKEEDYAHVDYVGYVERNGTSFPTTMSITFHDKSVFTDNPNVPDLMELKINPDLINISSPP